MMAATLELDVKLPRHPKQTWKPISRADECPRGADQEPRDQTLTQRLAQFLMRMHAR
jgi:hypothetical protein